jgi:ribose transport system substrate-binding protein
VVTLLRDEADSGRVSFVGVSSYKMGELFGEQLSSLLDGEKKDVCLLIDSQTDETAANLIYSRIALALNSENKGDMASLSISRIDSENEFETEEAIRNILMEDSRPDILICSSLVQTESALTAIIDYNLVSDLQIIGYYATDTTLSAVRRGLIPAIITIDPRKAGETAMEALDEYVMRGNVSDYFTISLDLVNPENAYLYIRRNAGRDAMMEGNE